jgi:hypothetical protein
LAQTARPRRVFLKARPADALGLEAVHAARMLGDGEAARPAPVPDAERRLSSGCRHGTRARTTKEARAPSRRFTKGTTGSIPRASDGLARAGHDRHD